MTIEESPESKNPNRIRCFAKDDLMPDVLEEKWNLVKVTCTQKFNERVQFGISFIKIHTSDAVSAANSIHESTLGPVISCDESDASSFSQRKQKKDSSDHNLSCKFLLFLLSKFSSCLTLFI